MKIIALSSSINKGIVKVSSSNGDNITSSVFDDILIFIAKLQVPDTFIVTWDLMDFLKPIYDILPEAITRSLNNGDRAIYPPFRLFLSVGKGKFLGINYKERIQIRDNNYEEHKYDMSVYELRTFFPRPESDPTHLPMPPGYILSMVVNKGNELLSALDTMGLKPNTLTSPAAIYEDNILRKMPIPTIYNLPDDSIPMLEACWNYIREWRSVYQIGTWDVAYDYDLCSAYPSIIARLPNLSKAEYIHTKGSIPARYTWGILRGRVNITSDISPLVAPNGLCLRGSYDDFITTEEWATIHDWHIGDFTPAEGWFFYCPVNWPLFGYAMTNLYNLRSHRNPLVGDLAKSAAVSVWGKFQEMHGEEYGDFWNSIYACMVASRARVKVCDFIYRDDLQNDLISVSVDGCLVSKAVDVPTVKRFGEWRLNPPGPAMVLSVPYQWAGDKHPSGLTVNEIIAEVKAHPKSNHWRDIYLETIEHDRLFDTLPHNGRDIIQNKYISIPFDYKPAYF